VNVSIDTESSASVHLHLRFILTIDLLINPHGLNQQ
jgi:hypothetical protein